MKSSLPQSEILREDFKSSEILPAKAGQINEKPNNSDEKTIS
jgi:hypothetical protein